MTNYEKIVKDKESLINFIDKYGDFDSSPWQKWFDEHYCSNCESEKVYIKELKRECECTYCEINNKCKYFESEEGTPSNKEIIEMWLEEDSF